ncbi:MAG: dihydrodipicolinate synthase family protein, partial [Steroidobacteraceae bacterium]
MAGKPISAQSVWPRPRYADDAHIGPVPEMLAWRQHVNCGQEIEGILYMSLGSILTAIVTPFDGSLNIDEEAFASLFHHLLANGSDGVVVCAT